MSLISSLDAPVPAVVTAPGGPSLSRIVAGAWRLAEWNLPTERRLQWIHEALDLGITTFDHADLYGGYQAERLFGEALARAPGLREHLQIVGKCGIRPPCVQRPEHRVKHYDTSAAHVVASVEQSLRSLHTDRLDLLLVHRPDALMEPDALARCFDCLRRAGKVLHFGVSNHAPSQFSLLHRRFALATNQIELSPLHLDPLEDGTLDQAQDLGIAPMVWSPLAGGRLMSGDDEASVRVRAVLERLAAEHDATATTIAFAWVLRHPSRPLPIAGTRHVARLREAAAACAIALDAQDWYEIRSAAAGRDVP
jgi:predicted oxidoreductase